VVRQYKDGGEKFQGFWLYSPHESFNADAVKITTDFVGQIEEDAPVVELFTSIFEFSQKLSHTTASRNAMFNAGTTDPSPQPPSRMVF
jgi:EAL domain-containing protein (putative c-di-GMP-specific phosphodiesterase class I)